MALQGSIKDFGLPDIFQLIGLQRKTGILTLQRGEETITVSFENGMVVNADTTAKRIEDRLGNLLVKQGKISEAQLEDVLQRQKATLQRVGHILVSGNFISAQDLKNALQVQINQNVFKLFRWKEGDYNFEPTEKVDYDRASISPMSADFILMEGIRMVDEWPIIEKKIPSMDIVFRTTVDATSIEVSAGEDDMFGGAGDSKKPASGKVKLSRDEERVYRKVDGQRTVQGIIDASGMGDFDVCKVLYDLLSRSIVAPTGRGAAARETGAVREAASSALGYGLLVAVLVLGLAGVGLHLRAPFGITGLRPALGNSLESVLESVSRSRLDRLDAALQAYEMARQSLPPTLESLAEAGIVDRSYLKDPWARPYHYEATASGYVLNAVDDTGKPLEGTLIERSLTATRP
jgi:predicted transcriptional regulator